MSARTLSIEGEYQHVLTNHLHMIPTGFLPPGAS